MSGGLPAIAADGLRLHNAGFDEPLFTGLGFTLAAGEAVTMVGPPGSGKSSLVSLILGNRRPVAGTVLVHGADPAGLAGEALARFRRGIGCVPQRGGLLSNLTLADNILLPLRYHRDASAADSAEALRRLFRLFELEDPPAVQAAHASATWRWIACLARALILEPELIIVDDLGEELDALDREDLWRLLWRVRIERGLTVLATSSDRNAARTLSDRIYDLPGRRRVHFRLLRASAMALEPYTAAQASTQP